ncbi:23S rRNA (guanosine(2251)-2'-O)-methyltransferase RlmB [Helicobacter sp. MIT 21-1697]|uniref:23S rRNA (guanosine(2251)-2'-O)-methyltransferase RlmB n=1 Tax=Helicobacter sp. MIT 21-1697 TaxID=2993733 RepID=UPI00224A4F82|nr:23S rRNA (guanosine(2251)-2'-O)-methyltransferase RlmB [Helicobacter sp. MIT 21-1697]MCX2716704.1 23S rRNA (guanosine(2251)-2'-O)-methyltransferase RlmB [Helicobacter sp. MIT 21-1697]
MIIYGKQPIFYALNTCAECIEEIYLAKELPKDKFKQLARLDKPIKRVDMKKAQSLAHGGNHQGILASITPPSPLSFNELKSKDSLLVLCNITDVGNIGSIFRTAYALGVGGVVICLSHLNQKAIESIARLSSGAFLHMPYGVFPHIFDIINELKNADFMLIGADMQGQESCSVKKKWVLFLGSESEGLSARLKHKLDTILSIKMEHHFDSLNVAVAAGILIDRINNARE